MTNLERAGRKITLTLLISQSLFSAATILIFPIGAIVAVRLGNDNSQWTGVPSTLSLFAAALFAFPAGWLMDRAGRRVGLSVGYAVGALGALVAGWGVIQSSLLFFLAGIALFGLSRGATELGRYAAAEANPPTQAGRAISLVVFGGTVGSIVGPLLAVLSEKLEGLTDLPELSGAWLIAAVLLSVGLLVTQAFLRPDPKTIARQLARNEDDAPKPDAGPGRRFWEVWQDARTPLAIGAMVTGQLAMVVVMTVTPIHMTLEQRPVSAISIVIMAHTLGMFGLSPVTGWLADRFGRRSIIMTGGLILIAACVLAPFATDMIGLSVALFLLGLGWNFTFVGGSALLDDVLLPNEKGRIQGIADALVKVSSGAGSLSSGFIFAATSFATTSWLTILVAVVPVALVLLLNTSRRGLPLGEAAST